MSDSASGGFIRQVPNLPATHAVRLSIQIVLTLDFHALKKGFGKIHSRTASGNFPQVAELNTPRSMDAVGEYSAYHGFKAC